MPCRLDSHREDLGQILNDWEGGGGGGLVKSAGTTDPSP